MKVIIHRTLVSDIDINKVTDTHVKRALESLSNAKDITGLQKLWIYDYITHYCHPEIETQVDTIRM